MNIIIGFLTGICASMGLGGGFILIIYLITFTRTDQLTAQGINLLFFLPIALFSLIIHTKNKLVEWKMLPMLVVTGLLGVLSGTFISNHISVDLLRKLFSSLLLFVGFRELFHRSDKKGLDKKEKIAYNSKEM